MTAADKSRDGEERVTSGRRANMCDQVGPPRRQKAPHTWRNAVGSFLLLMSGPEIEALLKQDGGLQAKTVWEEI